MLRTNKLKLDPKIYIYQAKQMILLKILKVCKTFHHSKAIQIGKTFFKCQTLCMFYTLLNKTYAVIAVYF